MKKAVASIVCVALVLCAAYFIHSSRGGKEIELYCGAGIRPAASALIEAFEAAHGVKVAATYNGSGRLLGQISAFQKGDLFMPGAAFYVDTAVEKNLAVKDTMRVVAYFVPVIFVEKGNPKGILSLQDLTREGVRLSLGDERSCAVGKKTRKILEKNNIPLDSVEKNVVNRTATVNELGVAIELGNADATVLWDANARHYAAHGDIVEIPPAQNILSTIPIVLLKCSSHPEEARAFIDFVTSEEGKRILTGRGYTVTLE